MSKNINEKLLSFEDIDSESNDLENLNELTKYNYFPKDEDELINLINKLRKERGNSADLNDIYTGDITDMSSLFSYSDFNGDISKWDVSNVKDMSYMFISSRFNGDISNWDVSNVTNMSCMFAYSDFNSDISKWDVSNVKNMTYIFYNSKFNCDISEWNINPKCDIRKADFPKKNVNEKLLSFEDVETKDNDLENLNKITKYNYYPKDNNELQKIVNKLITERGEKADLNDICTSQITDMSYIFEYSAFNGDISKWDVSNVEYMKYMFAYSAFNGDISNWDVSNVKSMSYMFYYADNFNKDISNWDVSNVMSMNHMFAYSKFTYKHEIENNWNINPHCKLIKFMFWRCPVDKPELQEKLLSFEDTDSESNDLENLNKLTKYNYYPKGHNELQGLVKKLIKERGSNANLNDICVSQITDMSYMFCDSNFNGDISKWDVSNVEDMAYMFYESEFNGDISKWDVSKVTDMSYMFYQSKFDGDISKWDVSKVENMYRMFTESNFNGDISNWDVHNVKNMSVMFCYSKFNGDISKWDVSNVKNMAYMFYKSSFNGDISNWDVSKVEDMSDIFANSLFNGDLSKWNINPKCNIFNANFPTKRKVNEKLLSFEDVESEDNDLENLNEITEIAERKKWLEEFKRPNSKGFEINSFLDYYLDSQNHTKEYAKYELYEDNKGDSVYINKLNYKPLVDEIGECIFRSASFWYYDGFGFFIEHRPSKITRVNRDNFVNLDGKLFFKKDIYTIKKIIYCEDDENIFVCFKPLKESNDYVVSQNGDIYSFLRRYNVYSFNPEYSTSKEFLSMFEKTSLNVSDDDFLNKLKLLEAKEVNEKLLSFEDTDSKDSDLENLNNIDNVLARKKEFEKNWEYLGDERYECNDLYRRVAKYKKLDGGSRLLDTCNFLINNGSYELLFPLTDEYYFHNVTRFVYLGPKYNLYAARVTRIIKDENDPLRIRPKGGVAFFEYNIVFNDGTFLFPEWVSKYYILPDIAMDKIGQTEEPFFNIRSTEAGTTFRFYFNGDIVDVSQSPWVKLPKDMTIEKYCRQKFL